MKGTILFISILTFATLITVVGILNSMKDSAETMGTQRTQHLEQAANPQRVADQLAWFGQDLAQLKRFDAEGYKALNVPMGAEQWEPEHKAYMGRFNNWSHTVRHEFFQTTRGRGYSYCTVEGCGL